MSGIACKNSAHRPKWYIIQRNCNHSAFNGNRRTYSAYSEVRCPICRQMWRTKADYVAALPDAPKDWWNRPG